MNRQGANRLARMSEEGLAMALGVKSGTPAAGEIAYDWLYEKGENVEPLLKVGECYFVKTVSDYYLGRLVSLTHDWMEMTEASWIPDTGRFNEFIRTGQPRENEPMAHGCLISIGAITAVSPWPHPLLPEVIG